MRFDDEIGIKEDMSEKNSLTSDFEEESDQEELEQEDRGSVFGGEEEEQENFAALKPMSKVLSEKDLKKYQAKIEKTGVCYMSRIPPFMKHTKLRSMLSKYGEIGRIFLNPEDSKIAAKRKRYKRNKRVNYVEGWIEFGDKKVARKVSLLLNNNNMGGKKRSYYYDDIWNIKYLPKFKWNHLTEQLAYELKVKEQRMRNDLSQARKESKLYVKNVQKAKAIEAMEARKSSKKSASTSEDVGGYEPSIKKTLSVRQRKVIQ